MCTPVERLTRQRCPKRLSQSEPVAAKAASGASVTAASALTVYLISMVVNLRQLAQQSTLFSNRGCIDRACVVAPARAHVGAERGDLLIVETDAQLEPAHPRPELRA